MLRYDREGSRIDVVKKWISLFPNGSSNELASLFTQDGEWTDHAFGVRARGRGGIEDHFSMWIRSVPNFTMTLERSWEVPEGVVAMYRGKGTMERDLPTLKANGTPFEFQGFVYFQFKGNLIQSLDESYTRVYQEIPSPTSYRVRSRI